MELAGPVGIRAGTLADDDVIEVDMILNGTGRANADNVLHAEEVEQFMGVDTDGRHAHAGSHDGDLHALVVTCVAVDATDIIHQNRIFQEILSDKFGPQGIAGHQNSLAEADFVLNVDVGSDCKVGHITISFQELD